MTTLLAWTVVECLACAVGCAALVLLMIANAFRRRPDVEGK